MILCENCLKVIESSEGYQTSIRLNPFDNADKIVYGDYDKEGNFIENECGDEYICCEWCDEYVSLHDAYEI